MKRLIGILLLIGSAEARWVSLGSAIPAEPTLEVISATDNQTVVVLRIQGFEVVDTLIGSTSYQRLYLPGNYFSMDIQGLPSLPVVSFGLAIPAGASLSHSISILEAETLSGYRVFPSQLPADTLSYPLSLLKNHIYPPFIETRPQ
ncbi:MAG: hypothetical protein ABIM74_03945 [candidate division WOR-3 bacterium]